MCGYGTLAQHSGQILELRGLRCKRWSCEDCYPRRHAQLELNIKAGAPAHLLTLTIKPRPQEGPIARRKRMGVAWQAFKQRIERHTRQRFDYFVVVEATKRGEPHFHIGLRGWQFVPQHLLSKWWEELTGAHRVDIREVKNRRGAVRYLSKYMGKGLHKFGTAKRYFSSRAWLSEEERERKRDRKSTRLNSSHLG